MLKREKYLKKIRPYYDSDLIKAIVGIRRCGKSTILMQIIEEIKEWAEEDEIIYFDFEDFSNSKYLNGPELFYDTVKELVGKLKGKKAYVFIDEVQYLNRYIEVCASIRSALKCSLFITGSTATVISGDLSSRLTGRYVEFKILPFSYSEVSEFLSHESDELFKDYLEWGGFPARFNAGINKRVMINDLTSSIIERDILFRHPEFNAWTFRNFSSYVLSQSASIVSSESIAHYISAKEEKIASSTCYKYLLALSEANMIALPPRFDIKGKALLETKRKAYATDPALVTIQRGNIESVNYSAILETVIYNELISRGYEVYTGKTYKGEIDFVVSDSINTCYLQVAYLLASDEVIKREFGAFSSIKDNWPKYVLSLDNLDFSQNGIIHMNIKDFLLEKREILFPYRF